MIGVFCKHVTRVRILPPALKLLKMNNNKWIDMKDKIYTDEDLKELLGDTSVKERRFTLWTSEEGMKAFHEAMQEEMKRKFDSDTDKVL